MFLQSPALLSRVEKSLIFDLIWGAKASQKSIETEVRKRIENPSPSVNDFYRFWLDFWPQVPPRNRPKIVKNWTCELLGAKT